MAVGEVCLTPGCFSRPTTRVLPPTSTTMWYLCLLTEIKDMFFGLQLELRICWSRVRDHFSHS